MQPYPIYLANFWLKVLGASSACRFLYARGNKEKRGFPDQKIRDFPMVF